MHKLQLPAEEKEVQVGFVSFSSSGCFVLQIIYHLDMGESKTSENGSKFFMQILFWACCEKHKGSWNNGFPLKHSLLCQHSSPAHTGHGHKRTSQQWQAEHPCDNATVSAIEVQLACYSKGCFS